jgi:hypothetical protein
MKYMLLIFDDPKLYEGEGGKAHWESVMAGHMRFGQEAQAAGIEFSGQQLQPASTATTIRTDGDQQTLHDGPFAETHEELGGFYLIDAPDLDSAIAWARKIPAPGKGSVEVRPVVTR